MGIIVAVCRTTDIGNGPISERCFSNKVKSVRHVEHYIIDNLNQMCNLNNILSQFMCSCSPNWSNAESTAIIYNWCLIVLGFLIPTLIIVVSNISVIHKVRKVKQLFLLNNDLCKFMNSKDNLYNYICLKRSKILFLFILFSKTMLSREEGAIGEK